MREQIQQIRNRCQASYDTYYKNNDRSGCLFMQGKLDVCDEILNLAPASFGGQQEHSEVLRAIGIV